MGAGAATPTLAVLAGFDSKRQGKTLPNQEWESPTDPDARVGKMKDGTTHTSHRVARAVGPSISRNLSKSQILDVHP